MKALAFSIAIIKQALKEKKILCKVPKTKLVIKLLASLAQLGYIRGFTVLTDLILVRLAYKKNRPVVRGLSLFSKPSNRVYHRLRNLRGRRIAGGYRTFGFTFYTTSFSPVFLTDQECLMARTGGEPLIRVS